MEHKTYTLKFKKNSCSIVLEFTKRFANLLPYPPDEILKKVRLKLESEKQNNQIDEFKVQIHQLKKAWGLIRQLQIPLDHKFIFQIGIGSKNLDSLKIDTISSDPNKVLISLSSEEKNIFEEVSIEQFSMLVESKLRGMDYLKRPDLGQLKSILIQAKFGEIIENRPLNLHSEINIQQNKEILPFSINEDESHNEIILNINNLNAVRSKTNWNKIIVSIERIILDRKVLDNIHYSYLYDELIFSLKHYVHSFEIIGLNLPIQILVAINSKFQKEGKNNYKLLSNSLLNDFEKDQLEKSNNFTINYISEDQGDTARFTGFGEEFSSTPPEKITLEDMRKSFAKTDLHPDTYGPYIESFTNTILENKKFIGFLIAKATEPTAAGSPYLREIFSESNVIADEFGNVDMKKLQKKNFVKPGDTIAILDYQLKAKSGFKVEGKEILPPTPPRIEIKYEEGIKQIGYDKWIAEVGGIPTIDEFSISLEKHFLHEGNLNASNGFTIYEGNATIAGAVEHGAMLQISGDLNIEGNINGGDVYCSGQLVVAGGINTTSNSIVKTKSDMKVSFIENSKIYCGNDGAISSGISNSEIYIDGNLEAKFIFGSSIYSQGKVKVFNLGREGSKKTVVRLGVDVEKEKSIEKWKIRIANFIAKEKEYKAQHRSLSSRSDKQKTEKHKAKEDVLEKKIEKIKPILLKANKKLENTEKGLKYKSDGLIIVKGTLASGTEIQIGKKSITLNQSFLEVVVKAGKGGNIQIISYEEYKNSQNAA